jgi:hypothetical protein
VCACVINIIFCVADSMSNLFSEKLTRECLGKLLEKIKQKTVQGYRLNKPHYVLHWLQHGYHSHLTQRAC